MKAVEWLTQHGPAAFARGRYALGPVSGGSLCFLATVKLALARGEANNSKAAPAKKQVAL